jgi:hypothetical protein
LQRRQTPETSQFGGFPPSLPCEAVPAPLRAASADMAVQSQVNGKTKIDIGAQI